MTYEDRPLKVHLYHDQGGASFEVRGKRKPYANTRCRHNHPVKLVTNNPLEVTCRRCLKFMGDDAAAQPPQPETETVMQTRYRLKHRWFRRPLIVLQVGEQALANYDPSDPRDTGKCAVPIIRWRDARAEDLINGDAQC